MVCAKMNILFLSVAIICVHSVSSEGDSSDICSKDRKISRAFCRFEKSAFIAVFNNTDVTESQLRNACRDYLRSVACIVRQMRECRASDLGSTTLAMLAQHYTAMSQWDLCDQADLYITYQALLPCLKTNEIAADVSNPTLDNLVMCWTRTMNEGYTLAHQFPVEDETSTANDINLAFFWPQVCCAAYHARSKCGRKAVGNDRQCTNEAMAAMEKIGSSLVNAFNCSTLAPIESCPRAEYFADRQPLDA